MYISNSPTDLVSTIFGFGMMVLVGLPIALIVVVGVWNQILTKGKAGSNYYYHELRYEQQREIINRLKKLERNSNTRSPVSIARERLHNKPSTPYQSNWERNEQPIAAQTATKAKPKVKECAACNGAYCSPLIDKHWVFDKPTHEGEWVDCPSCGNIPIGYACYDNHFNNVHHI